MKRKIIILLSLISIIICISGIEARADDSIYENNGELVIETDVIKGYAFVDQCYEIMKGGTYTVSMAEGIMETTDVILIDADDPVTLVLDNVNIRSDPMKTYYAGCGAYGTPAVWIDTNLAADVTIIYKGNCRLKGANQWSAIMKYNSYAGGKLTVKPFGSDDDSLTLEAQAGYGIGSHSDEPSASKDVVIEGGRIHGAIGAEGVTGYVINGGYHVLEKTSSTSWQIYPGLGSLTINSGTVISSGPVDETVVVTYNGGNFFCKKEVNVIDGNGEEARLVVFPAGTDLTGVEIDGSFSACTASRETNSQLYIFLSKKEHSVALIYGTRREEHTVHFVGDKAIISGDVQAIYPDWAIKSIKNATVTGIPEEVEFTGKRIKLDDLIVSLNGAELIQDQDYIVNYKNNLNEGVVDVTIKGINNYKDCCYGRFKIVKTPVEIVVPEKIDITGAKVSGIPEYLTYTGVPLTLSDLKISLGGKNLKYNQDYTVYYYNNTNIGTLSYTIRGIYDYTGDIKGYVEIKKGTDADQSSSSALKKTKITGISKVSRKADSKAVTFTLKLKWKKVSGADGYYIMYKGIEDSTAKQIAKVKGTTKKVKIKIKKSLLNTAGVFYVVPYTAGNTVVKGPMSDGRQYIFI